MRVATDLTHFGLYKRVVYENVSFLYVNSDISLLHLQRVSKTAYLKLSSHIHDTCVDLDLQERPDIMSTFCYGFEIDGIEYISELFFLLKNNEF